MNVHCKKCGHAWVIQMKLPMLVDRFVKAVKGFVAAGCPNCGATGNNVLCGASDPGVSIQRLRPGNRLTVTPRGEHAQDAVEAGLFEEDE